MTDPGQPDIGPRWNRQLLVKRALMQGFLVGDHRARYPEFRARMTDWLTCGRVRYREDIVERHRRRTRAFIGLLAGANRGKTAGARRRIERDAASRSARRLPARRRRATCGSISSAACRCSSSSSITSPRMCSPISPCARSRSTTRPRCSSSSQATPRRWSMAKRSRKRARSLRPRRSIAGSGSSMSRISSCS